MKIKYKNYYYPSELELKTCQICHKEYSNSASLKYHLKNSHKIVYKENSDFKHFFI